MTYILVLKSCDKQLNEHKTPSHLHMDDLPGTVATLVVLQIVSDPSEVILYPKSDYLPSARMNASVFSVSQ